MSIFSGVDKAIGTGVAIYKVGVFAIIAILSAAVPIIIFGLAWWAGLLAWVAWGFFLRIQWYNQGLDLIFASAAVGQKHDVYETAEQLQSLAAPYKLDPRIVDFDQPDDSVFIGNAPGGRPVWLLPEVVRKNHISIMGASGTGKSKLSALLLAQMNRLEDAIVVFDPKDDEFLPGILQKESEIRNVPMAYINLRLDLPQINPFAGATRDQIEEVLTAGLNLDPSGNAAVDFHRGEDRDAAALLVQTGITNIPDMLAAGATIKAITGRQNFWREFKDLARLPAFHTVEAPDLEGIIQAGGIIYIVGDTDSLRIQAAQRLLLSRILQIIKGRDRSTAKQVSLFLDEFKYMLSNSALRALGTIRDRRCNLMLAFQSYGDLEDCGNLPAKAVLGAAKGNTTIKFVYKLEDAATAKDLALMSGEERIYETTHGQSFQADDGRGFNQMTKEGTRQAVTVDMLTTNLPKPLAGQASVGWVFGLGPAFPISTMHMDAGWAPEPKRLPEMPLPEADLLNAQAAVDLTLVPDEVPKQAAQALI